MEHADDCAVLEAPEHLHDMNARDSFMQDAPELDETAGENGALELLACMDALNRQVRMLADQTVPVLVRGEAGAGKEMVARALHALSPMQAKAFLHVNCVGLHASDARWDELKAFLDDARGTVFLDEATSLDAPAQTRLLEILQGAEAGGVAARVRIISSTSRDLEACVAHGEFIRELYFRLKVVSLTVAPLRQQSGSIGKLAQHLLARYCRDTHRDLEFSSNALRRMTACSYPGNLRELHGCVLHAATLCHSRAIPASKLACNQCIARYSENKAAGKAEEKTRSPEPMVDVVGGHWSEDMRLHIENVLERCGWVQAKAARALNMTPRQIGYAIQRLGIEVRRL